MSLGCMACCLARRQAEVLIQILAETPQISQPFRLPLLLRTLTLDLRVRSGQVTVLGRSHPGSQCPLLCQCLLMSQDQLHPAGCWLLLIPHRARVHLQWLYSVHLLVTGQSEPQCQETRYTGGVLTQMAIISGALDRVILM